MAGPKISISALQLLFHVLRKGSQTEKEIPLLDAFGSGPLGFQISQGLRLEG